LASKQNLLVRYIPVYNGWLEDSKNCYMGKTNEAFIQLFQLITNEEQPSLTQAGYQTAKERSLNNIAEELKNLYESVMKEKFSSKLKKVHQPHD
ncbi:glycosyl transferase family 1, partial [Enterococcus lactis]